ncbi:DUF4279 domain-containing protein [Luteibacter sp. SG786]|uniref:DUF4279 domain-containing protein n=1 Tax=Luteibacter sp. SG786 TaxID=2587130 RepID=UPI00141D9CD8|nr:DUF4279 domain-containing protein [Luteibacter sp. SG786]NII53789.1 hypothetical protein [Luteibacter sp. SG786]
MPSFARSRATLRIAGELLVPDEVSRMLGSEPTDSQQKGGEILGQSTGQVRIARTGMWKLVAQTREPEDLCGQIDEILGKLTNDQDVWADIRRSFSIDLFCGLFMGSGNDGISLPPERLQDLAERGIELALDIYDSTD